MPRTPDRFPGPREEEEVQFAEQSSDPTVAGALRYVDGVFRQKDSVEVYNPRKPRNIWPIEEAATETTIYVRTTGSDTTGDGESVGTAFRTIAKALTTIPYVIWGERYIIDCTDLGQELSSDPLQFPPFFSPDPAIYDASPAVAGFNNRAPLTIQATPTLVETITAVQITGHTQDSVAKIQTLQTSKTFTADEHKGRFLRDSTGRIAPIASNTTSDIEYVDDSTLTGPVEVLEQSAEIRNSGTTNAVETRTLAAKVQWNGIKLTTASASSWRYGLFADCPVVGMGFTACFLDGMFLLNGAPSSFSGTVWKKRCMATGHAFNMFNCFVYDAAVAMRNSGSGSSDAAFWFEVVFDGCSTVGGSTGIEYMNRFSVSLDKAIIRDSSGDGFYMSPGFLGRVRRTRIQDCAGNGVLAQGTKRGTLLDVSGTGNTGLGLKLSDGAQVNEQGTVDVTGTGGDYQVGAASVGTWTGYSGDENDLGAASPQLCRLFG